MRRSVCAGHALPGLAGTVLAGIRLAVLGVALGAGLNPVAAVEGSSSPYTDAVGDISVDLGTTGDGTLDITGMEISNTATDLVFKLTVNGNVSTTDWGKFMIGIATGKTTGTATGNGWARPINLAYDPAATPLLGMNHWIGSWVDLGGGGQFWTYDDGASSWSLGTIGGYSFTGGTTSELTYTVPLSAMNLIAGDVFYFDAYSSGGNGGDSAVDSLANAAISITGWSGPYTSSATAAGGLGLNSYTVAVPEPAPIVLVGVAMIGLASVRWQRRRAACRSPHEAG